MFKYIKFDLFIKCNYSEVAGKIPEQKKTEAEKGPDLSHLSPEDRIKVESLRKDFENVKSGQKVVGNREQMLRERLLKEGDPQDKEYREIAERIQKLQEELKNIGEKSTQLKQELAKLLGEVKAEIKKISPAEINILKSISNNDFLNIPNEKRLQYITKDSVDSAEISNGSVKNLEFSFTFDGQFNRDLYLKTTAGQVLPKEVGEVKIGGEVYSRNNVGGEFFTPDNKRLIIQEGTKIEIGDLRTKENLEKLAQNNQNQVKDYLEKNPEANKNIVSEAINRGIDPKFATLAFSDLIKNIPENQIKQVLEDSFTEFDRIRGNMEASSELQDGKYDENLSIGVFQKFSPDNWKDKAIAYGFSEEKIENFIKVSNTKIDFSSIENGDMKAMIEKTAENLGVSEKIIQAILKQESNGNMSATRFEKHVYDRELRKGNSPEDAKLLATSFGGFQIMGFNYKVCGYENVNSFVEAMKTPENQFNAFANFIKSNSALHNAMKGDTPNFEKIAYYYNGPMYSQNNYDNKIRQNFYT